MENEYYNCNISFYISFLYSIERQKRILITGETWNFIVQVIMHFFLILYYNNNKFEPLY